MGCSRISTVNLSIHLIIGLSIYARPYQLNDSIRVLLSNVLHSSSPRLQSLPDLVHRMEFLPTSQRHIDVPLG